MMRQIGLLAVVLWTIGGTAVPALAEKDFSVREFAGRGQRDLAFMARQRAGLQSFHEHLAANEEIFRRRPSPAPRQLTVAQRDVMRAAWLSLLDRYYALDSLRRSYEDFAAISHRPSQFLAFRCHLAAFMMQYRHALEFLLLDAANPEFDVILNEPMAEQGVSTGTYADFKLRFLNAAMAAQFLALQAVAADYRRQGFVLSDNDTERDSKVIWQMGRGAGMTMTLDNALTVLRQGAKQAFFPVQAGISEWLGDTRVGLRHAPLISAAQLAELQPLLRPGDILLERREWYLSNIGLPGYWPHAALYIGTPAERRAWFGDDLTRQWVREQGVSNGEFEDLLMAMHLAVHRQSLLPVAGGPVRVIEAMSEGVIFNSLEQSAACDSLAALRPRVTRAVRARAILRAFAMHGHPYDFNFDFLTDSALVCTELVYKAYEPDDGEAGITRGLGLPLRAMLGRQVMPANDLALVFDQEFGQFGRQFDLIAFYDGDLIRGRAVAAGPELFRNTWRRPKWHHVVAAPAPAAE